MFVYCLFFVIVLIVILVAFKLYIKLTTGWCTSNVCLKGKTVLITGANTGIGYETALNLAMRGARVILACRNELRAVYAQNRIVKETRNLEVFYKIVDLASFASVRNFAQNFKTTEKRLDVLINNAGVYLFDGRLSRDGINTVMQVNYFAPVLLTHLLLDMLQATSGRIVNVSSVMGKHIEKNDNLTNLTGYIGEHQYHRSKLCNILYTKELATRLRGTGVTTYSLHPGVVRTEMTRNMSPFLRACVVFVIETFFKNAVEGAQTSIHCAVANDIERFNGEHFHDCRVVATYKTARDSQLARRVWNETMEILKIE